MKRAIAVLLFLFVISLVFCNTSHAWFGFIAGKAFDAQTGAGIPGPEVQIIDNVTGEIIGKGNRDNGGYYIFSLPYGTFKIKSKAVGYYPVVKTVKLYSPAVEVNFKMYKKIIGLKADERGNFYIER